MSQTYTISKIISGQDLTYMLQSDDNLIITRSGNLISPDGGTITSDPTAVSTAVLIQGLAWLDTVELFSHDAVTVGAPGILKSSHDDAVKLGAVGGNSILTNQGLISSDNGFGAVTFGGANYISNSGTISGSAGGVSMGMDYTPGDQLFNTGTISSILGDAVFMGGSQDALDNYGLIHSYEGDAVHMLGDYDGSAYVASFATLDNFGQITTSHGYGVVSDLGLTESHFTLVNFGLIAGKSGSIISGNSADSITNSGILRGDVVLNGGDDSYLGRAGHVYGNIDLGDGNDMFDGRGNTVSGKVFGGAGNDTYYTDDPDITIVETATPGEIDSVYAVGSFRLAENVENLTLLEGGDFYGVGNSGDNRITGNVNNNVLSGLGGQDTLYGMDGNDTLLADWGNDRLFGGDGSDLMQGGDGNDTLFGDDGKDTLEGGFGRDIFTGGDQTDEFRFVDAARTSPLLSKADVITDFTQGEDVLNIHLIDADTTNGNQLDLFTFIGRGAFDHTPGEVRYFFQGSRTIVAFDTDGDGHREAAIILRGHIDLQAGDFML